MPHKHPAVQIGTGSLHDLLNFGQNRIKKKKKYQVPDQCTEIVHTQSKLVHTLRKIVHTQSVYTVLVPNLGRTKFR